jgi:peptide chain release factor 2
VLQDKFNAAEAISMEYQTLEELLELAEEEDDAELIEEITDRFHSLAKDIDKLHVKTLLSQDIDQNSTFLEINAGAGGTEAQDWADMLLRMYMRWAENHGYTVEMLAENKGEEAGIKSATIKISGHEAYGWLKTESGVHRLVRISPFDSNAKRHTSFASVWVYPEIDDNIDIQIEEKDLRIDTYRSSGAGGQHVNVTDSAVRITHVPSGIVVQSQSDRSQHRNKATCMSMLKSRLFEMEMRKKQEAVTANQAGKKEIGWGSQIRSYVLHPYQMVKDLRTDVETSNTEGVLDGEIDDFLQAALAAQYQS